MITVTVKQLSAEIIGEFMFGKFMWIFFKYLQMRQSHISMQVVFKWRSGLLQMFAVKHLDIQHIQLHAIAKQKLPIVLHITGLLWHY